MSEFTIYRNKNFASIPTYHLKDQSLSLKAVGLLTKMLLLPVEWDYSLSGLATLNKDGIKIKNYDDIYEDIKELNGRVLIDPNKVNAEIFTRLDKCNVVKMMNPTTEMKCIKKFKTKIIIPALSEYSVLKPSGY